MVLSNLPEVCVLTCIINAALKLKPVTNGTHVNCVSHILYRFMKYTLVLGGPHGGFICMIACHGGDHSEVFLPSFGFQHLATLTSYLVVASVL